MSVRVDEMSMKARIDKIKAFKKECTVLHEASSSKSSLFLFDNYLKCQRKYTSDAKIHDFVLSNSTDKYYRQVLTKQFLNDINSSDCDKLDWLTFATGGMRKLEVLVEQKHIQKFYSNFKELVSSSEIDYKKELHVKEVKTITAEQEGIFALLSNLNASIVFDLGGATGQITDKNGLLYTNFIGKDLAKNNIGNDKLSVCYNNKSGYNGDECRDLIKSHLDTNFSSLSTLNLSNKANGFFGISNFYNFLNDVCETYIPYFETKNIEYDLKITDMCISRTNQETQISIKVVDYKIIADEFCQHWGNWSGKTASFALDICFSLNYSHQILKTIGFDDNDSINISGKDWSEGAVSSYFHQ
jgi:hypothetical protein